MLKQSAVNGDRNRVAEVAVANPRQLWLAGLGAAVLTRQWARNDAGHVFRSLVREGSGVEARAIRSVGRRLESSLRLASVAFDRARSAAQATVKGLVASTGAVLPRRKAKPASQRAASRRRAAAKRASPHKARRNKRSA